MSNAQASAGPRSHRRRFRQQPRAAVCAAADQVDLGRSGLRRRLQGGRRSSCQGHRDAGLRRRGQADGGASRDRRQSQGQHRHAAARAVLRPLRRAAGRSAQSVAPSAVRARRHRPRRWPQDHRRARRRGRQGPVDDLRRGLPRLEIGDGIAAGRRHHRASRAKRKSARRISCRSSKRTRTSSRPTSRWSATPACGTRTRRRSRPRCAGWSMTRSRSRPPTATCIPASSAAARATRSGC